MFTIKILKKTLKSIINHLKMNRMKQITILGGSGFLGSVLSDLLVEKKYKVVILDTKLKGHF